MPMLHNRMLVAPQIRLRFRCTLTGCWTMVYVRACIPPPSLTHPCHFVHLRLRCFSARASFCVAATARGILADLRIAPLATSRHQRSTTRRR